MGRLGNLTKKENPKLLQKKLSDGRISLYLEYYIGRVEVPVTDESGQQVYYTSGKMIGKPKMHVLHNRRKEALKLYLIDKPRSTEDRQRNREIIDIAERIRFEREQEFLQDRDGYRLKKDTDINFFDYIQDYIDSYTKKDVRMVQAAKNDFRKFIEGNARYKRYSTSLLMNQIDKDMVTAFVEWLQEHHRGEGGKSVYSRFKKVVLYAHEHGDIKTYPCKGVQIKVDANMLRKDTLTPEEIKTLLATHYANENQVIRNAFTFSLFCGLRWCDIIDLTYDNIDFSAKRLHFEQNKTKGHSASSAVVIPLSDSIMKMIGTGKRNEKIFKLPTYDACLHALKRWVKRAGIDKNISWHCARHSFGTNLLSNGANIKTVASLLGHSDLRHTEKYVRAVDKLKEDAIKSLGDFEI